LALPVSFIHVPVQQRKPPPRQPAAGPGVRVAASAEGGAATADGRETERVQIRGDVSLEQSLLKRPRWLKRRYNLKSVKGYYKLIVMQEILMEAKRSSILRAALAQLQGTHYHRQVTKLEESFRAAMEWGDEASTEQIQKELYSARRRLAAHEAYFRGCLEALREVDHLQRRKYEAERQNNFVQARILHRDMEIRLRLLHDRLSSHAGAQVLLTGPSPQDSRADLEKVQSLASTNVTVPTAPVFAWTASERRLLNKAREFNQRMEGSLMNDEEELRHKYDKLMVEMLDQQTESAEGGDRAPDSTTSSAKTDESAVNPVMFDVERRLAELKADQSFLSDPKKGDKAPLGPWRQLVASNGKRGDFVAQLRPFRYLALLADARPNSEQLKATLKNLGDRQPWLDIPRHFPVAFAAVTVDSASANEEMEEVCSFPVLSDPYNEFCDGYGLTRGESNTWTTHLFLMRLRLKEETPSMQIAGVLTDLDPSDATQGFEFLLEQEREFLQEVQQRIGKVLMGTEGDDDQSEQQPRQLTDDEKLLQRLERKKRRARDMRFRQGGRRRRPVDEADGGDVDEGSWGSGLVAEGPSVDDGSRQGGYEFW